MKNIKRIIKEEIDDFEWAKGIEPYQYSLSDDEWNQLNKELIPLLQNEHLRTGQAYMIALGKVKPSLYDYVTGKDMDPFNNDKKVIKLIRFLNGDNDLNESIKLPVEIGDTVYMGKFKNKKTVVKDIEWNEKGDLMINGKSALKMRIPKKVVKEEINDFEWTRDVEPMEPQMEWLKDNFDNLVEVIEDGRVYYVDNERKPLFYYYQDEENGVVWINYHRIWSVLIKDFGLNHSEIEKLIKGWLESTYNLRGFTPNLFNDKYSLFRWNQPII